MAWLDPERVVGAQVVDPAPECGVVLRLRSRGDQRCAAHQPLLDVAGKPQAEEMDQRQVNGDEQRVLCGVDDPMRQSTPEQAEIAGPQLDAGWPCIR